MSGARHRLLVALLPVLLLLGLGWESFGRFDGWGDETSYLTAAQVLADGKLGDFHPLDGRLLVPVIIYLFKLTGLKLYWAGALAAFSLSAAAVWLIGAFWGRAGYWGIPFLSACLLASCPLFAHYSSAIYPEPFAACFVVLTLVAHRSFTNSGLRAGLIVGLLIGAAVVLRQNCIVVWPVLLLHTAWHAFRRRRFRPAILYGAGTVLGGGLILAATTVFFAFWTHDPFYFVKESGRVAQYVPYDRLDNGVRSAHESSLRILAAFAGRDFAFVGVLLPLAGLVSLFKGKCRLEAALGLSMLGYLAFGSVSLSKYIPPAPIERYLVPVVPFLAICLAWQIHRAAAFLRDTQMLKWLPRGCLKFAGCLCVAVPLAANLFFALLDGQLPFPVNSQLEMFRLAAGEGGQRVFITQQTSYFFRPLLSQDLLQLLEPLDVARENAPILTRYGVPSPYGERESEIRTTLPGRFKVMLTPRDARRWRVASQNPVSVTSPRARQSLLRRLIDRVRGRKIEAYPFKAPIAFIQVDRSYQHISRSAEE